MTDYLGLLNLALTGALYDESAWQAIESPKSRLKRFIVEQLARRSYRLMRMRAYSPEERRLGRDWPFIGYTMIGLERMDQLQRAVETVISEKVPGDLVECGVWRGGAAIFMAGILKTLGESRTVWLADSFEGLPAPSLVQDQGYDLSENRYLSVSLKQVRKNFERFNLAGDNVRFLKGWFSETLPNCEIEQIAVLRLDGDLYESTMDALVLYDKVSQGGFIIIDDYHDFPPCRQAVTDFLNTRGLTPTIHEIDGSGVFWRKELPIG